MHIRSFLVWVSSMIITVKMINILFTLLSIDEVLIIHYSMLVLVND